METDKHRLKATWCPHNEDEDISFLRTMAMEESENMLVRDVVLKIAEHSQFIHRGTVQWESYFGNPNLFPMIECYNEDTQYKETLPAEGLFGDVVDWLGSPYRLTIYIDFEHRTPIPKRKSIL